MHSYIISDAFLHNFRYFLRLDPMPQLLSGTYRQDLHIFILNYRSGGNNTEYQTALIYASNRTYFNVKHRISGFHTIDSDNFLR